MSKKKDLTREAFPAIITILQAQWALTHLGRSVPGYTRNYSPWSSRSSPGGRPHRLFWVKHRTKPKLRLDWICGSKFTVTGEGETPELALEDLINNLLDHFQEHSKIFRGEV